MPALTSVVTSVNEFTFRMSNMFDGNYKFDESLIECIGTIRRNVDQKELGILGDEQLNVEIFKLCIKKTRAPYFIDQTSDMTEDEENFQVLRDHI